MNLIGNPETNTRSFRISGMTAEEISAICERHRIPKTHHANFCDLVLHGRVLASRFARLVRQDRKFKTCLEELRDVLSRPYKHLFAPSRFESLTQDHR